MLFQNQSSGADPTQLALVFEPANQIRPVCQCSDFGQCGLPLAPSLPFAKWRRGPGRGGVDEFSQGRRLPILPAARWQPGKVR